VIEMSILDPAPQRGTALTRGEDIGVVTWPINGHWCDVRWQKPDGSQYVERSYLPECKRVNEMERAA
jgi:hypothetical protein